MKKFETKVVDIGEMAKKIFSQNIMVLFSKKEMPLEMKDISIMHSGGELIEDIIVGDTLYLGDRVIEFLLLAKRQIPILGLWGMCA